MSALVIAADVLYTATYKQMANTVSAVLATAGIVLVFIW